MHGARLLGRTTFPLLALTLFLACAAATAVAAPPKSGCAECHPRLSQVIPAAHAAVVEGIGSCLGCHAPEAGTSLARTAHRHYAKSSFSGACASCHVEGPGDGLRLLGAEDVRAVKAPAGVTERLERYVRSWAASAQLDAKHGKQQVDCAGCHGTAIPEARPKTEDCLRCHETYEAVAARTRDVKPNPHESHLGEIRCTLCHRAHVAPVFYCERCHSFDLKVR
jgi:hypothetical protein